jgi:hypothetical protein
MKKTLLAGMFSLICSTSLFAAVEERTLIGADPTNWRLQTYTSTTYDTVATWFTGSPCVSGNLTLLAPGAVERTRYWDTVMAAKLSKKRISLYYNYDTGNNTCVITSYWFSEP